MDDLGDTFTYDRGVKFADDRATYVYRLIQGKSGNTWIVPANCPWSAENIHVDQHDPHSKGYGGRMLTFPLEDGTTYEAKGPWHTNPHALLDDTGVDIRDRHRTYGCVALDMKYGKHGEGVYTKLIHVDREPILGTFDRLENMARAEADKRGHPIAVCSISSGGSQQGWEYPGETDPREWKQWHKDRMAKNK
jgi:hypothetical protein